MIPVRIILFEKFIVKAHLDDNNLAHKLVKPKPAVKNRDGLVNSNDWETPDHLYNELNREFKFDFDPCPLHAQFDGLTTDWGRSNYCNPPYDRDLKPKFIAKGYAEWQKDKTVVFLIPSATGTKQFHELLLPCAEIRFVKGRIAFKGINTKGKYVTNNKGKHDSMIVILKGGQIYSQQGQWISKYEDLPRIVLFEKVKKAA